MTFTIALPPETLVRGFWLYVWRVIGPDGAQLLYVGRTGDNSSPHATAPFTRMGQHLGFRANQSALRNHLGKKGIAPEACRSFELICHGPVYPALVFEEHEDRAARMARHKPIRNLTGGLECDLCNALKKAGYKVLNHVAWRHKSNPAKLQAALADFAAHFPLLLPLLNDPAA